MKRIFTSLKAALLAITLSSSFSSASAQSLEQGNVAVDAYYGFPNLASYLIRTFADDQNDVNFSAMGPIGARFEYMASGKMGVGLEFNYTSVSMDWKDTDSATSVVYNYKVSVQRTRIMPRFNIHFGQSENFDGYFGIAAGYLLTKYKYESNDPNNQDESTPGLIPFALRVAVGGKYFFSDNIGLHMELGLGGGALIHGGLSFKF